MSPTLLKKWALAALEDLKAVDVVVLDVRHLTTFTDTMIICTGTSNRHVKSLADNLVTVMKSKQIQPLGVEGEQTGEWILVDLADVVVHIMLARTREFYCLEKLWGMDKNKAKR